MTGPWTTFLVTYGLLNTLVTCILAALYAHCGNSETEKILKGNSNLVSKTEIGIINFDNGQDNFSDTMENCNCGLLQLEWTVLEIIVVGLIGLATIGGFIKGLMHFKNMIHKRNENVRERKRNLEIEMREKIRNEFSTTKSADPNQTTRQDAITVETEGPEVARITYP
jgi:hypothetical protein